MSSKYGFLLIIGAGVLYGTIPIFANLLAERDVSTMQQIFIRLVFSVPIFLAYFLIRQKTFGLAGRDFTSFFLFGLVGIALFFSLYMAAAVMTSVTVAVLLLYTQPVYTLILARLILKQKISPGGIAAVVISLAGVAVIFKVWALDFSGFSPGHIFGLLTGLCYGIYIIFMRKYTQKYQTSVITFWTFLFGLIWLIPVWIIFDRIFTIHSMTAINFSPSLTAWLLLLGFMLWPTILGYLAFNHGMRTVEPHHAGVLVLSEPLSAIIISALLLSQPIILTDLIGGLLIIVAFLITRFERRERQNKG